MTATPPVSVHWGHPRTYGATCMSFPASAGSMGSSPHLRGNRLALLVQDHVAGVIPAPTGQPEPAKTVPCSSTGSSPHLRGNRRAVGHCDAVPPGHPRTYGATGACQDRALLFDRVIPAPTGQPARRWPLRCRSAGSSPHLRGNRVLAELPNATSRVIPAPTGQPGPVAPCPRKSAGHPRTYGATVIYMRPTVAPTGSSPHLRGNPSKNEVRIDIEGVIPAPTGHTLLPGHNALAGCGSSPHLRGQPWREAESHCLNQGHPRTYGATLARSGITLPESGSSPHLRGNRDLITSSTSRFRVIPAPTGQPEPSRSLYCCQVGHPRTYGATGSAARRGLGK